MYTCIYNLYTLTFAPPVDGTWAEWSTYSACSESCGPGKMIRTRQCTGIVANGQWCEGATVGKETWRRLSARINHAWYVISDVIKRHCDVIY